MYGGPRPAAPRMTLRKLAAKYARGERISVVTAYDYPSAVHVDLAGFDVCLVGDSAAMVVHGHDTTLPITLDEMLTHCRAVARGAARPLLVGDLPFGSYERSPAHAVASATRLLKEGGMDAVKLEGGGPRRVDAARALVDAGVAVMGHVGLTPQSISVLGGFRPQGRSHDEAMEVIDRAVRLRDAGCFAIVLECVPGAVAAAATAALDVPTIGIGAGADADGGDVERRRRRRGDGAGDALEDDREAPRVPKPNRAIDHLHRLVVAPTLGPEPAEDGDGLRGEADVAHHRDAGVDERPGGVDATRPTALELHRVHAPLLQKPRRGRHRVRGAPLVGAEREVADEEGPRGAARDRAAVREHLVEGDGERRVVAVHDHRRAVPDEAHVEAREVDVHGARVIVRGDDADALAAGVLRRELAQGHARRRGAGAAVHRVLGLVRQARGRGGGEEGTRKGREEGRGGR